MRAMLTALVALFALGCAGDIVEYEKDRKLSREEIKKILTGDDFRQKNKAREQIEKLPPAERVKLFEELIAEGDSPTRMLALSELMKMPPAVARPTVERLAKEDPDEEIREFATMVLEEWDEAGEE